ncbi:hypothetical protein F9K87_22965 [Brucella anthropi]|uniref:rhamnan synthesis F family protein n=1 Tax=Brucella anthropi TaxID=529 RepID=UPI00124C254E|nr:rhamnan synthesis F family protein [Brucella anthropi]KAB2791315.1 hypothetical protein F9K87_22965 [Brucella anthropi]
MVTLGKRKKELGFAHQLNSTYYGVVISPGGSVSPHGSTYIRVLERLKVEYQPGLEWAHLPFDEAVKVLADQDFLLVQRNALSSAQAAELVSLCRQVQTRLVFEIDDDLTDSSKISNDQVEAIKTLLFGADVVLTSTNNLRKKLRKYNADVRVIPNKICGDTWFNDGYLEPPLLNIPISGVKILYMGTFSHAEDLEIVRPALDLLNKNGTKATLYAIGVGKNIESGTVNTIAVPSGWSIYPKFVKWLRKNANNFDFAVAPLIDNEFNRSKSGLKYMDYGALGLAGLFSESQSYNNTVKHYETGLLVKNTTSHWYSSLKRMSEDADLRHRLASSALQDVQMCHTLNRKDSEIYAEALGLICSHYHPAKSTSHLIAKAEEFDPHWYLHTYEPFSMLMGGGNTFADQNMAAKHYLEYGADKGHDPSPDFSTGEYLKRYKDVAKARMNPLLHYLRNGKEEGRQPKPLPRLIPSHIRPDALGPVSELLPYGDQYIPTNKKIAVHFHAYHPELVEEALSYLKNIKQNFTLLVSTQHGHEKEIRQKIIHSSSSGDFIVQPVENRGRDVAPWLVAFRDEIKEHNIFCHIHTKKTVHKEGHARWREYLLHEMLGSPSSISKIVSLLDEPINGLIFPAYYYNVSNQPQWGANKSRCQELLHRLGHAVELNWCEDYPAGSFFWAKTEVLTPLFDLDIKLEEFDPENGQNDATLAHAIERIIGFLPGLTGFKTICTAVSRSMDDK